MLLFWAALNTCTNTEESGRKEGIEKEERDREREKERERKRGEADELGLMELKAKLIPRWPSTLAPTPKKAGKDMV